MDCILRGALDLMGRKMRALAPWVAWRHVCTTFCASLRPWTWSGFAAHGGGIEIARRINHIRRADGQARIRAIKETVRERIT